LDFDEGIFQVEDHAWILMSACFQVL
jgi:hypothetical protein